jgi:uncharacterized membrane protein YfcA
MDDQPNPYESPKIEATKTTVGDTPALSKADDWKFALLAGAILLGVLSIFPWLGAIFAAASSPIFLRYFQLRRNTSEHDQAEPSRWIALATGTMGLGIGIAAASAGAFFGVCSGTGWTVGLPLATAARYDIAIVAATICGIVAGLAASVVTLVWLPRRIWRRHSRQS